jgi:CHAT domain-containing protein/Flp pilus assembly protein TadD
MINNGSQREFLKESCLTEEDLYRYSSTRCSAEKLSAIEAHLANCSSCRRNLAGLLEILHPDGQPTEISQPSKAELDQMISLVREVSRREHPRKKQLLHRFRWPLAAAAAIGFIVLGFLGYKYIYEIKKSETFCAQARAIVEDNYAGTSPSNLRLALPFNSVSENRSVAKPGSLRLAENLFFQALAIREDMIEAHMGLAYIYIRESQFTRARDEFQKVLRIRTGNIQALLGRAVSQYEEAIHGSNSLRRYELLKGALTDFDAILKTHPDLAEARYDKVWTLFESGQHKEALKEIESYLSRDSGSIWAEELKRLKIRIQATSSRTLEDEINRAAHARDQFALAELTRQAPNQMPSAIWSAMRRSLALDHGRGQNKGLSSEDLRWAAEIMEAGYSESTGDHSFRTFIEFYTGLSPPERDMKKSLDQKFQTLVKLHQDGKFDLALNGSKFLASQYAAIKDLWQLVNLHHLRGNSLYLGKDDYRGAEAEYRAMLDIGSRLNAPDLIAKALKALAMVYSEQRKFSQSLDCAGKVKDLAKKYGNDSWLIYACIIQGNDYRLLGQFEKAIHEYATALSIAYPMLDGLKIIEALENSGIVMDRLGRIEEARAYYRLAMRELDSFLMNHVVQPLPEMAVRRVNLLFKQGDLALRIGDLASAESFFRESLKTTPPGMIELEARNRICLAEICLRKGQIQETENILQPAKFVLSSGYYPELQWRLEFIQGRVLKEFGRSREALLSFRDSIQTLEQMRQSVGLGDLRQSFLIERYEPYRAAADLLAKLPGDHRDLLDFVDRAKSKTLKESIGYLGTGARLNGIPGAETKHSATIVEYFFTHDKLLIIATAKGKTEVVVQNISSQEISRQRKEFEEDIKKNDSKEFVATARRLYTDLITPIETFLFREKSEVLVILPDGPLYLLPFSALLDPAGQFLIEKTPIVFAPSRSVFQHCLVSHPDPVSNDPRVLLIDGSAGLRRAQEEIAYLSQLYGDEATIVGSRDLPISAKALKHSIIVHFSGHAVMQQGRPVLIMQTSPRQIYLDSSVICSWKMPEAVLVNLAGCNTGIGPIAEGESPWGLIPAFLDAGTNSIVASLMDVDDTSIGRLNRIFYDLLKKGFGKARALQEAQLSLLRPARSDSVNPRLWAPYILVGNPH